MDKSAAVSGKRYSTRVKPPFDIELCFDEAVSRGGRAGGEQITDGRAAGAVVVCLCLMCISFPFPHLLGAFLHLRERDRKERGRKSSGQEGGTPDGKEGQEAKKSEPSQTNWWLLCGRSIELLQVTGAFLAGYPVLSPNRTLRSCQSMQAKQNAE
ncbi:hypothetical protein BDP81DRAFT_80762 [Colletotrichum phormii]|uniref:Uncharacterized protein n=1 Tax=Colletotrichum phormii TaxID=359342 RepID=A0AAJ0A1L8_9PEZI|nr:uncharacterized protein BDP81DRAFT_80762 [Colletotrichum phormii]KAK1654293.1 hypothetical protein BDP81DRAFT_80762 [Colletotrichum phormii]